ncbi:MAG: hypothetical protein WA915_02745 [Candidatus Aminicenantaceae bacterium]
MRKRGRFAAHRGNISEDLWWLFSIDFEGKIYLKVLCLIVIRELSRFLTNDHTVLAVILSF